MSTDRPGPPGSRSTSADDRAASGRHRDPAARRRRHARGAARAPQPERPVHGRRVGVPGRGGRPRRGSRGRCAPRRGHPRARGGGRRSRSRIPASSSRSRAGSPRPRSRSASTPGSTWRRRRQASRRARTAARSSTPAGIGRRRRSRPAGAASCSSCSRRSSTSSSCRPSPPPTRCSPTRAGARSRRCSPASCTRARRRGSCCPASPATRTEPDSRRGPGASRPRTPGTEPGPIPAYLAPVTASLPADVQAVFDRFITTELTTVNRAGQPITWPVTPTPYYRPGDAVHRHHHRARLSQEGRRRPGQPARGACCSPTPPEAASRARRRCLVQGSADVDDRDLDANRERYARESAEKLARGQPRPAARRDQAGLRLVLQPDLRPRPARARLRLARTRCRARALRHAHGGGPLGPFRGAGALPRGSRGRRHQLAPAPRRARHAAPDRGPVARLRLGELAPATQPRSSRSSPPMASRSRCASRSEPTSRHG